MKLLIAITTALLASVFAFSQNSQPIPTKINGKEGVFLTLNLMDSISVKLIDRNVLKEKNNTLCNVVENLEIQNEELKAKESLFNFQLENLNEINANLTAQKNIALENLEKQKILTKNTKKKLFKKTLFAFCGGLVVSGLSYSLFGM